MLGVASSFRLELPFPSPGSPATSTHTIALATYVD